MQQKEQHFEIKPEYAWFLELPLAEQKRVLELYEKKVFQMKPSKAMKFIYNQERRQNDTPIKINHLLHTASMLNH